ncbi:MAG: hypothetical protein M1839_006138 [Geoglossum umbratile]|nr:MAG: hypothetical protein M1839_006138 [Geoglossum umbratile]
MSLASAKPSIPSSVRISVDSVSYISESLAPPSDSDHEMGEGDEYKGINWERLPDLQKPPHTLKRTPSWIYQYGYRCALRSNPERIIFICRYCFEHKFVDTGRSGRYDVTLATTAAASHLRSQTHGHGVGKHGKITFTQKGQRSIIQQLQISGMNVPQEVANSLEGFNIERFRRLAVNWLIDCWLLSAQWRKNRGQIRVSVIVV